MSHGQPTSSGVPRAPIYSSGACASERCPGQLLSGRTAAGSSLLGSRPAGLPRGRSSPSQRSLWQIMPLYGSLRNPRRRRSQPRASREPSRIRTNRFRVAGAKRARADQQSAHSQFVLSGHEIGGNAGYSSPEQSRRCGLALQSAAPVGRWSAAGPYSHWCARLYRQSMTTPGRVPASIATMKPAR